MLDQTLTASVASTALVNKNGPGSTWQCMDLVCRVKFSFFPKQRGCGQITYSCQSLAHANPQTETGNCLGVF